MSFRSLTVTAVRKPAQGRDGARVAGHEDCRLDAFERLCRARKRAQHEEQRVDGEAPQNAMIERLGNGAEKRLRPECRQAEETVRDDAGSLRG